MVNLWVARLTLTFLSAIGPVKCSFFFYHMCSSFLLDSQLMPFSNSFVVYYLKCWCSANYVGQTSLCLITISKFWLIWECGELHSLTWLIQSALDSGIGQHLFDNFVCASEYQENWFDILHKVCSQHMLRIVEAVRIKFRRPTLCRQMERFSLSLLVLQEDL